MPYKTLRAAAQESIVIEKSEFIAKIAPVSSAEEAAEFIDSVRAEHRRARHNCYAYSLREGFETRFSDDGEPQGTAGPPILDVIQKNGLIDVCIVVTRYFGGILLGKGGLTRAYSSAAAKAAASADIMLMCEARTASVKLGYPQYEKVLRLIPEFEIKTLDQDFADSIVLELLIKAEFCEPFSKKLADLTSGQAELTLSDIHYADFA